MEGGCGAEPDALERHVFDQPLRDTHVGKSVHLIQDNLVARGRQKDAQRLAPKTIEHICKLQKQRRKRLQKQKEKKGGSGTHVVGAE